MIYSSNFLLSLSGYKICLLKAALNYFFRFITFYKNFRCKKVFYQSKTVMSVSFLKGVILHSTTSKC